MATIRRILIGLDSSSQSLEALDEAAEMAERLGAELVGLYIEDENVLRSARLPFTREVGLTSTLRRNIDGESLESCLRALGERVREAMEQQAAERKLRWSLKVIRGSVVRELCIAAGDADLVALGKNRLEKRRRRMGSTAQAVWDSCSHNMVLLERNVHRIRQESIGCTAMLLSARDFEPALKEALALAHQLQCPERILFLAQTRNEIERKRIMDKLASALEGTGIEPNLRTLPSGYQGPLVHAFLDAESAQAFFLLGSPPRRSAVSLQKAMGAAEFPIFVFPG